jgi:GT2 family glycosyltransferase
MLPEPGLVARHLARHAAEPEASVAVLGDVRWHPEVAGGAVNRWLEWSGTQFDYRQLAREARAGGDDAGFGRFYSCNVSLKRELFEAVGGFDPEFELYYEDLDFGWRASRHGMRLRYEPAAVALHLHRHDLDSLRARFEGIGAGERLMAAKHSWFTPWYRERIARHAALPQASRLWPVLVDRVPESLGGLRAAVEARADTWYHQRLERPFLAGWHRRDAPGGC